MQVDTDCRLSLHCCECSKSFGSAALLLKHFSAHVASSTAAKKRPSSSSWSSPSSPESASSPATTATAPQPKQYPGFRTQLQRLANGSAKEVRRRRRRRRRRWRFLPDAPDEGATAKGDTDSDSSSEDSPEDSILQSALTQSPPPPTLSPPHEPTSPTRKGNMGLIVLKLDLHERVRSCVPKLVLPGNSDSKKMVLCNPGQKLLPGDLVTITTSPDKMPEVKMLLPASEVKPKRDDEDDFDPSKFCQVTLEEGEGRLELGDSPQSPPSSPESPPPSVKKLVNHKVTANGLGPQLQQQQQKKYVCTYCHKRFGWSTDLKRHILTHTGERPFVCRVCGADFTRNFLLQKHTARVHPGAWVDGSSASSVTTTPTKGSTANDNSRASPKKVQPAAVGSSSAGGSGGGSSNGSSSLGVRKKLILKLKPRSSGPGSALVWNGNGKKRGVLPRSRLVWKAESGT